MSPVISIDSNSIERGVRLFGRAAYGIRRPPVEARDFKIVGGRAGKVKCGYFTVHAAKVIHGWKVWAKPFSGTPHVVGFEFGVLDVPIKGHFIDLATDHIPILQNLPPFIHVEAGRLLIDCFPLRATVKCETDKLQIEVTA